MQNRPLHLALITEQAYRAEVIEYMAVGKGWHVLTLGVEPHPAEALRQQAVDLVLIDLEAPGAVALFRDLTSSLPDVPLLALVTPEHLADLQDARFAGAQDFVAFPINHQHFQATLERALQIQPAPSTGAKKGRTIAVASLKGGIGRSTLAANLAVALRQRKIGDVILAEAHYGLSHLSLLLNLQPRHTLANLATEANLDLDFVQGLLQAHQSGVRLLAAPSELAQVVEIERETWQRTLALLPQLAAYVIVDTAATIDAVLSEVLIRADDILLVTGPDIASLYSTRTLLATLRAEKEMDARLHVVLNQAGGNGGLSNAVIEKHLGEKISASVLTDPPVATYALNRGIPFVISHARAPISRSVQKLVDHLLASSPVASAPIVHRMPVLRAFLGQPK